MRLSVTSWRVRRRSQWLWCMGVVALAAFAGPAASAERSPAPQDAASAAVSAPATVQRRGPHFLPGLSEDSYKITLITGDVVKLTATGGRDRYDVDFQPAPRPNGTTPAIQTVVTEDALYAIPLDVQPLLASGRLDLELFNVAYLAANDYDDKATPSLPVIAAFPKEMTDSTQHRRAQELPASRVLHTLESIDAAGLTVKKANADAFWASLRGEPAPSNRVEESASTSKTAPRSLAAGVTKLWLSRRVTVDLDESVPMIGAPEAWAAGSDGTGVKVAVLDTGIDQTHPDVAGKVIASESFIPGESVVDGHGHGTHVSATIVGSGAAQGGTYRGVAPGADLIVGKVLNNGGSGTDDQVIAGMEWAAQTQGADVVSMSLGACCTDGSDAMSQAVNRLTKSTGSLFVISAGNNGAAQTIGTPGSADAALTVAAVDKADQLASFSSRGPRRGDYALKPDIAAPGVSIVAARASGTSLGSPVNDLYTSASGTSMATPHVAGAAAIVAQQYPDWDADELKPALMSTAKTVSPIVATITSGAYAGTKYHAASASGTPRIDSDTTISGTPSFVGEACDPVPAGEGIALIERTGTPECPFQLKLDNIVAAGYDAAMVLNSARDDCLDLMTMEASGDIPFVFVNRLTGLQLLQDSDVTEANVCTRNSPPSGSPSASTTIEPGGDGYSVFEQGAGRVDVARAVGEDVFAATSNVDFRVVVAGDDAPVTKTLSYENVGAEPVTLDLTIDARSDSGSPVPTGAITFDAQTLTVPARGRATASVTLDPSNLDFGAYSGSILATAPDGTRLRTPVAFRKLAKLHVTVVPREGVEAVPTGLILAWSVDGTDSGTLYRSPAEGDLLVRPGTYSVQTTAAWVNQNRFQLAALIAPEVEVSTTAEVVLDANEAQRITFDVPRPAEAAGGTNGAHPGLVSWQRGSVSGDHAMDVGVEPGYQVGLWATPTDRVTKGTFIFTPHMMLAKPLVMMTLGKVNLHPYEGGCFICTIELDRAHFSGRKTFPVVYADHGTPEDFARVDARGKLVLVRPGWHAEGCSSCPPGGFWAERILDYEVARRAAEAGARGILIHTRGVPGEGELEPWCHCVHQVYVSGATAPTIPFVALPEREADLLFDKLQRHRKAAITVEGTPYGTSPYLYALTPYEEGRVPTDLHYDFAKQDLAVIDAQLHAKDATTFGLWWYSVRPVDLFEGRRRALSYGPDSPCGDGQDPRDSCWKGISVPGSIQVLVGPTYSDAVHVHQLRSSEPPGDSNYIVEEGHHLVDEPFHREEHWNSLPVAPGAPFTNKDGLPLAQFTMNMLLSGNEGGHACIGCRQGDRFYPAMLMTPNEEGRHAGFTGVLLPAEYGLKEVHLYRDGQEIQPTDPSTEGRLIPGYYAFPPEIGRYRLTLDGPHPVFSLRYHPLNNTHTIWEFTSSTVIHDETPPGTACQQTLIDEIEPPSEGPPCRAEPLIFLRYDAEVGLDNAVRAGRSDEIRVTAYRQAPSGPKIAGLKLWISTDDGADWDQVKVKSRGKGVFEADVRYPRLSRTTGAVSLKAEAWDAAGNRVEQTIERAYFLREGGGDDDDDDD